MKLAHASILGFCIVVLAVPALARHDEHAHAVEPPSLVVTGTATVQVTPDEVTIRLGVTTEAKTVAPAAEENAQKITAVLTGVQKSGVTKEELSTGNFSIEPAYDYNRGEGPPRITGYRVSNVVVIQTKKLDRAGAMIDAAITAGANEVQGVSFGLSDPRAQRDEALRLAVANARADAEHAANASAVKLGPIRRIMVGSVGGGGPIPVPMFKGRAMEMAAAAPGAAPDLMPGKTDVYATVTIEYDLLQ